MRLDHITERTRGLDRTIVRQEIRDVSTATKPDLLRRTVLGLPDDDSELEPPDPIPNSAVKRLSADGSVGFPHVRVGHRQAS